MNKNSLYSILFCIVLIVNNGFSQHNWEYRSNYEIKYSVSDGIDFKLKPKIWFEGIIKEHYSSDIEIGFDKKLNNWLSLSSYYRYIIIFKENSRLIEYRPHADIMFSYRFNEISFQSRNRIEYRIRNSDKSFRYRNMLTIKKSDCLNNRILISISEEPFYDCTNKEYVKNRVYFNLGLPIKNKLSINIVYILENNKIREKWQAVNIFGTTLKYKI